MNMKNLPFRWKGIFLFFFSLQANVSSHDSEKQ